MTVDFLLVLAVIAVFSVVQSLFGMGVLVFGTPTLLLMGYDFVSALTYLLPASFAISLLQVINKRSGRALISPHLYTLCLPGIGAGLWMVGATSIASWANLMIGVTLIFSAIVRFWDLSRGLISVILERHLGLFHLIMGLIHGLTNLGGALLAILATETQQEKEAIRLTIAHYYLAFSVIQLTLLATVLGQWESLIGNLPLAAVSAVLYLGIGNRIFVRTSNPMYHNALTLFIAVYGVVVLLKFQP